MSKIFELKTGELFAGAGGLGLGFTLAEHPFVRFCPIFAFDNDAYSLDSYRCNMMWLAQHKPSVLPQAPKILRRDVEKLAVAAVRRLCHLAPSDLDLLVGGPPCQGYSTSNRQGKKQHKDQQNRLIKVFLDKLDEFRPRMFLLENVQGVRWTEPTEEMNAGLAQGTLFKTSGDADVGELPVHDSVQSYVLDRARACGYRLWHSVLDAADFGVPQHRPRFVLFGMRSDFADDDDDVNLSKLLEKLQVQQQVSVMDAIGDLPALENGQRWENGDYQPSDNEYVRLMRRFMDGSGLYDHVATKHQEYVIERFTHIPEGGNWENIRDMLTNYKKLDNTHSNIYRRLRRDVPAHTISHYRKSMVIHPTQNRGISMREACRLQSFPDWFRFQGPIDEQQQQLGNAVPPLMASAIATAIAQCWENLMLKNLLASAAPQRATLDEELTNASLNQGSDPAA